MRFAGHWVRRPCLVFGACRKARTLYGAVPRPVLPAEKDQEDAAEAITSRA